MPGPSPRGWGEHEAVLEPRPPAPMPGGEPGGAPAAGGQTQEERDAILERQKAFYLFRKQAERGQAEAPDDVQANDGEAGVWRTINGRPVFIQDGESLDEAERKPASSPGAKGSRKRR